MFLPSAGAIATKVALHIGIGANEGKYVNI
jgi:hypothetical protein